MTTCIPILNNDYSMDDMLSLFDELSGKSTRTYSERSAPMNTSIDTFVTKHRSENVIKNIDKTPTQILNSNLCPNCHCDSLTVDGTTSICTKCGTEAGCDNICVEPEWSNFEGDSGKSDNSRCGAVTNDLLYESSFSTRIATNGYSNYLYKTIGKLQSWQMMTPQERSLKTVFDTIYHHANAKGIPASIIEYAQVLFKNVVQEQLESGKIKLCRGDKRDGLIAACLFYSCSLHKVNRSKKEISQIFEIEESDVTRGCKLFYKLMNLKIRLSDNVMTHSDFIDRFCSNLGLNDTVKKRVHEIADKAHRLGIVQNNTPPTVAAGAIFFVSTIYSLNLSKTIISQQCQTSSMTITKTYNKLISYLEHLI